jgi:hypothetical protein
MDLSPVQRSSKSFAASGVDLLIGGIGRGFEAPDSSKNTIKGQVNY